MSSSSQRTPSLHDYDEDQYEPVIHDQAPIPRLERAINSAIIASAVLIIDKLYEGRAYPRFYALETVARVPYFSFLSVLHLYETLGFWRRADYLKVHFAETMNEFHHLLIMESMGGDERFVDRFFAQHMAVAYYFIACGMYLLSPRMAYNLSEQVEEHAYHTYDEFLEENEDELRKHLHPRSPCTITPRATCFSSTSSRPDPSQAVTSASAVGPASIALRRLCQR